MSRRGAHSSASTGGLDSQPPPFLTKTYDLVSDPATDDIVSWSNGGKSFTVWKNEDFSRELLGKFFKHNNFSSFVRQLNTYGFRKVDSDRWEFYEENFQQGRRDLLHLIHRRKPSVPQAGHVPRTAIEVGQFGGISDEIDGLKRDKNVLMVELVRLRQQQAQSDLAVRQLQQRLEVTESRQSQMMAFLSKALQNPGMLQQLVSSRQNIGRLENGTSSRGAQRKKLKRRASKVSDDQQQSDRESGEQMSDDPHVDMSTALVQYHQHSPDFAAMLRGFPEISEVPSPTQSGSGGAGAATGWAADLSGMGSAFGGMQLSNSAGIVRASPVPSNVTILEQMDAAQGAAAAQPGVSLGMPAIPTTSSPLDGTGAHRLGGGNGSFLSAPPPVALENGPVGGVPTVGATPLSSRGAGQQGLGSVWQPPPEVSAANDSMLSGTDAAADGVGIPAVTSVPISSGFPAAGSSPPFARIKSDPASDLVMAPNGGFDSFVGRDQSVSLPAGLPNGGLAGAGGSGISGLGGVSGSGGSYGFDDFKLDLLKAPSGPADFMGDDDLWEQFMATSPAASGALGATAPGDADEAKASASKPIESDDHDGSAEVTAHFGPGEDPGPAVVAAAQAAGLASAPEHTTDVVPPVAWTQTIKDSYQPLCVVPSAGPHFSGAGGTKALWIVPDWSEPPDPDAVNVVLTPGVAFGTGDHVTTRMCLRWLHSHGELQGQTVLDYGAGSGVLALAALRLGAERAVAVDCDPLSVRMCAANAELNGLQDSLEVVLCAKDPAKAPAQLTDAGSGQRRSFDVCVANILRGPLLKIAPRLAQHVRPGGWLALSGILEGEQAAEVCRAYSAAGFENLEVANEEGWSLIKGNRKVF